MMPFLLSIFSEIRVVPLETTGESLISGISQIVHHQSRYYVLDTRSQQVFCFDEDGNFVFKISAQGRGPGEYNYIQNINIDPHNNHLLMLDPPTARVFVYNLEGKHVVTYRIPTQRVMGLNKVFAVNDTTLLITSITYEQFVFYNTTEDKILHKFHAFDVPSTLNAFMPSRNVYQLEGKTYGLPALSNDIMDLSGIYPELHFTWCFGPHNNSEAQINRLISEIKADPPMSGAMMFPFQHVGRGKTLSSHILEVLETPRYHIAVVQTDQEEKFVVRDKQDNSTKVFSGFSEGFTLYRLLNTNHDRVIDHSMSSLGGLHNTSPERRAILKEAYPGFPDEVFDREIITFSRDVFSARCRDIMDAHNDMEENPYLMLYLFNN